MFRNGRNKGPGITPDHNKQRQSRRKLLARHGFIYSMFTLLFISNVMLGVALVMSPEISALFGEQEENTYQAYQDRILQLRMEVDRLHSRQYLQTGNLNLKMQELMQQQQVLTEQHQYIRILAEKAEELGITTAAIESTFQDVDPIATGSLETNDQTQSAPDFEFVTLEVSRMMDESRFALSAISDAAKQSTSDILTELRAVGISLHLPDEADLATGGPFLPQNPVLGTKSLAQSANHVLLALERFQAARLALTTAPIHHPLASARRISSTFGNRRDPFGGSTAFHSGIDYPAPSGTSVFSAGQGKVIFAGRKSGYGKLIEIEHNNGLVTRYAHLSAILVQTGQFMDTGSLIGKVGSTGRSTGPHLHFEVRRDATPVNPANFLRVAQRLRLYMG